MRRIIITPSDNETLTETEFRHKLQGLFDFICFYLDHKEEVKNFETNSKTKA